jgi:hypothetical protein
LTGVSSYETTPRALRPQRGSAAKRRSVAGAIIGLFTTLVPPSALLRQPQPSITACFLPRRCPWLLSGPSGTAGCSAAFLGRLPRHGSTPGGWSGGCDTSSCALQSAPRPPPGRAEPRKAPPRRPPPCPWARRSSSRSIGRASARSPVASGPIAEGSDRGGAHQSSAALRFQIVVGRPQRRAIEPGWHRRDQCAPFRAKIDGRPGALPSGVAQGSVCR